VAIDLLLAVMNHYWMVALGLTVLASFIIWCIDQWKGRG
jgi:hypothetical protein